MDPREVALNLLAENEGSYLIFDMLGHPKMPKVNLSNEELWESLQALNKEGLVAYTQERLDGPLFTLSKSGRELMVTRGFMFNETKVENTRKLFFSYFCKTEI